MGYYIRNYYIMHLKNLRDLNSYAHILESCSFNGFIRLQNEVIDAKDFLMVCEKCISKKVIIEIICDNAYENSKIAKMLKKIDY